MEIERNSYWDYVKGISIIAVILIHTTANTSVCGMVWRQFINFPVFLFFVVAGYFCKYSGDYVVLLKKKGLRLIPPFFIFSLAYAILDLYFLLRHGGKINGLEVARSLIAFGRGWGYFVLALAQCYLVVPLLAKMKVIPRLVMTFVCYLFSAALMYGLILSNPSIKGVDGPIPFIFVTTWIFPFALGFSIREAGENFKGISDWSNPRIFIWGTLLFLLSVLEGVVYHLNGYTIIGLSQIKLSSVVFSVFLSLVLFAKKREVKKDHWRWLAVLGEASLFVYLSHRLLILAGKSLLSKMCLGNLHPFVFMVLVIIIVVFGEWLCCSVMMKTRNRWLAYLGFPR
jgi:fucose 4-O-acetylase-like acetyltransferase